LGLVRSRCSVWLSAGPARSRAPISVTVNEVNVPPALSGVPTAATIDELTQLTFTAAATDPDLPAQALTFSLVGAPAGASIDASTGAVTWTPGEDQTPGAYRLSL